MIVKSVQSPQQQRGIAMLLLVMAIALVVIAYVVSELSMSDVEQQRKEQTMAALKKAKQALLAFAMYYPEKTLPAPDPSQGPGNLPCPAELNGVQKSIGNIGAGPACTAGTANPGAIGLLPWVTLRTGPLKDGTGEPLWYAVSNNFAAVGGNQITSETTGQISLKYPDGSLAVDGTSNDAIVAVIIAPGEKLIRDDGVVQVRETDAQRIDPVNYLDIAFSGEAEEEDNADFIHFDSNGFIQGPIFNAANQLIVNDQVEVITYGELMSLVEARVASTVSVILNDYLAACEAFPEASLFDANKMVPFRSASLDGSPPPEQRVGHLPLEEAAPVDWGGACTFGPAPVPPQWLFDEGWHLSTLYVFAYNNAVSPGDCGLVGNPDCLIVNNTDPLVNNGQALLVFGGRQLAGQARPGSAYSDYFEGENLGLDETYDAAVLEDAVMVMNP